MTTESLIQKREELLKQFNQIQANLNATTGAIQLLNELIEEAQKSVEPEQ